MKTGNSRQTVKGLLGVSIFGSFFRKGINSLPKSGGYPVKVRTFSHTFNETYNRHMIRFGIIILKILFSFASPLTFRYL